MNYVISMVYKTKVLHYPLVQKREGNVFKLCKPSVDPLSGRVSEIALSNVRNLDGVHRRLTDPNNWFFARSGHCLTEGVPGDAPEEWKKYGPWEGQKMIVKQKEETKETLVALATGLVAGLAALYAWTKRDAILESIKSAMAPSPPRPTPTGHYEFHAAREQEGRVSQQRRDPYEDARQEQQKYSAREASRRVQDDYVASQRQAEWLRQQNELSRQRNQGWG